MSRRDGPIDLRANRPPMHDALSPELRKSLDYDSIAILQTSLSLAAGLKVSAEQTRATARTALEEAYVEELIGSLRREAAPILASPKFQVRMRSFVEAMVTELARDIVAELETQGWRVEQTSPRNWKCSPPDRQRPVVFISEGSNFRAFDNAIANLRKSGFVWPPAASVVARRPLALVQAAEPDKAWQRLKDARELFELAADEVEQCETALKEAQARYEMATREREKAAAALRAEKVAFDRMFSGERA